MIAISGKERSGTTWLEHLLRRNYIVGALDVQFKHHFTGHMRDAKQLTIVLSKHPLEWWHSYYMYLRRSDSELRFENMDVTHAMHWNVFYSSWLRWAKVARVVFLRYCDLYEDPEKALTQAGLKRADSEFDRIDTVVGPDGTISDDVFFRRSKAMRYEYASSPDVLDRLNDAISSDVVTRLGYHGMTLEEE